MGETAIAHSRGHRSGSQLGRYTLGSVFARGGMGEVYFARAGGAGRFAKLVALKVLLPQLTHDSEFVKMFLHEGRIAAALSHPNIATVIELGESDGDYFMAMEYVHGRDLRSILRRAHDGQRLPMACALTIAADVCAGLAHAHAAVDADGTPLGVVHRDVSPSNVIVRYDGHAKIIDFGIAKATNETRLTRTGTLKGKPGYMSPEQCVEGDVGPRTDIYGVGILLYEATVGRRLFVGDNEFAIMGRVIEGDFDKPTDVDPTYPPELEAIVLRALAVDPAQRFESARALRLALEEFARETGYVLSNDAVAQHVQSVFGDPPLPVVAVAPPRRRGVRWGSVVALLAGGAALAGLVAIALSRDAPSETSPSPAVAAPPPSVLPIPVPTKTEAPAAQAEGSPPPHEPRRKRRRPKRSAKPKKPARDLDALLPASHRDG